ncbi:biosynthetic arginine decarboxylase [Candidatus Parabeggiatoa sp. HSG14]|uniref:biosynthetic arginine decarboxylase n=1 Tax=Candidatus Parabeggiatoa sp. HSG14 TaxID=3055593 RepID=UPI0032E37644
MTKQKWDVAQSRTLYNIEHWSEGYFDINEKGEVTVSPLPKQQTINLYELAQSFTANGLSLPVLVRFPNILHHRVDTLCQAFSYAMQQKDYQAKYTAIYPIKVNQQHHVIKEILSSGQGCVGLEAGSKSELMAVLALAPPNNGIVICNGYKDREYIRLALIGQQIGLCPYLVIEKISELNLIIEESHLLNVIPRLGMRVRLASIGKGKWQNTGGERGKFGLSAAQVQEVISRINEAGFTESLQLMHFHIGSQVANIRDIQKALSEAARYYAELRTLGIPIQTIDVGGGLGIDYDGTRSCMACSINYSIQEYANNVVHEFFSICNALNLPQPDIITESGRAMTAHHAVLVTNVIDVESSPGIVPPTPLSTNEHPLIQDLWHGLTNLSQRSALEAYHDAVYWLSEVYSMFTHGVLSLTQRARAEQLYYATCWQVRTLLQARPHSRTYQEVLDELNEKLVDKYFCNFSLFQSVPDAWAINQLFPIIPLHRLNEYPDRRATLQDLTCDSDGQFKHYVSNNEVDSSLPLHVPNPDESYLLGIFLVGAYQEILGDMHNLFGDTYSVNVHITPSGNYELIAPHEGDTVQTMLNYVNFDTGFLRNTYRKRLQAAYSLTKEQRQLYLRELEAGLVGYTYLEM